MPDATKLSREERLDALDRRMAAGSLAGHWQPRETGAELVPWVWPWEEIAGCLDEAGEVMAIGGAEKVNNRRTVQLINPSLTAQKATSRTLQMSVQLVKPSEVAECHRHTIGALRFVVQSTGTYTTVEGEQMLMEPGDLVLTPNWLGHDHANFTDTPAVWLDVLDVHLTRSLAALFQEPYAEGTWLCLRGGSRHSEVRRIPHHSLGGCHRQPYTRRPEPRVTALRFLGIVTRLGHS